MTETTGTAALPTPAAPASAAPASATSPSAAPAASGRARRWGRFALHYVEMIIAMFAGMVALDPLWSAAGIDLSYDTAPEAASLLMAWNMSVGMTVWMRVRGHAWRPALEMCAAMFAPVVLPFPLLWAGAMDGMGLMMASHIAMFPLMLAVMLLRRDEYMCHRSRHGHAHRHAD